MQHAERGECGRRANGLHGGIYCCFAPPVHAHAQRGISVHIACSEPTSWYPGLLLGADKKESEGVLPPLLNIGLISDSNMNYIGAKWMNLHLKYPYIHPYVVHIKISKRLVIFRNRGSRCYYY